MVDGYRCVEVLFALHSGISFLERAMIIYDMLYDMRKWIAWYLGYLGIRRDSLGMPHHDALHDLLAAWTLRDAEPLLVLSQVRSIHVFHGEKWDVVTSKL